MPKALLIIDMQRALDHPKYGKRNNLNAEVKISCLLESWRTRKWPVIFIQDCSTDPKSPFRPGQPLHYFKDEVRPHDGETIVEKRAGDAFDGTGLNAILNQLNADGLIVTGCHSQYCVSETVRSALLLGHDVTLVSDAVIASEMDIDGKITPAEDVHRSVLNNLKTLGAEIRESGDLLNRD